jgi:hypothetical protein
MARNRQRWIASLHKRIVSDQVTGCWIWTGAKSSQGYAKAIYDWRVYPVHRVLLEESLGPIAPALQVDHLCRNRACCNPAHLEPVTQRENILRGESPSAQHARKTHCPRGHAYTPDNTYRRASGARRCRSCTLANNRTAAGRRAHEGENHAV